MNTQKLNLLDAMNNISEYDGMDGGIVDMMDDVEQGLMWRMYYFPGGRTKRWISGVGVDTDEVHYDGITGDRDIFAEYNPRYLDQYVIQSQQNGWYNHFIYFNGKTVEHTTIAEAAKYLSSGIVDDRYYGYIAGLVFFDKLELMIVEYEDRYAFDADELISELERSQLMHNCDAKLEATIGVTKKQFLTSSSGWLAQDNKFCFAKDIWDKYQSVLAEYEMYREKLWESLSAKPCFQLCTNVTKGIFIGNVTISQATECEGMMADCNAGTSKPTPEQVTVQTQSKVQTQPKPKPTVVQPKQKEPTGGCLLI